MSEAGRGERIVLIEDDPDIAALVEGILDERGQAARQLADLDGAAPDPLVQLVITDLVAIRSYDREAARAWVAKVRASYPNAAVIVSTAHGPAKDGGARAIGADAVLTKPFDVTLFGDTVEALLRR